MKKLGKKLVLNKKTIDILDDKTRRNVKGGQDGYDLSCVYLSCGYAFTTRWGEL